MSERLPVTARGTEPARATVVGSVFDLHGLRCRPDPATAADDETEMQAAVSRPNLAFPLLPMQVEIGGRGDLGVELRRRELLRRPPDVRRALALGHPHQPVLEQPAVDPAFAQALELVQAQLPITPDDPVLRQNLIPLS